MKYDTKNRVILLLFILLLALGGLLSFLLPKGELSRFERRKLKKMPELTLENVFSGKYFTGFDAWLPDHFPLRDSFRALAAGSRLYVFSQADSNGLYLANGSIYKMEYPEKPGSIEKTARVINSVIDRFPDDANIYMAVIPDKNYYAPDRDAHPALDYESFLGRIQTSVPKATYISLLDCLTAESFYRTDTHWRQERLAPVVDRLCEELHLPLKFSETVYDTEEVFSPFYGVLYGQLALPVKPESLAYLTNQAIAAATVENAETGKTEPVYHPDRFSGMDPYDLFLSGAVSCLKITNESAATDRELILFRDSFGSSLAPLLIANYRTITLVDLRYLSSAYLDQFLTFEGQDVLFLYSTLIWNGDGVLK